MTQPRDTVIGDRVVDVVARDVAAWRAYEVLSRAGGEVFAVGGVVRDVALGEEPNDVDLMVRRLSREQIREALELLPGRVSEVGKSFGILEHRCREGCVQVSLPRKDRFIGVHHTDVDVQVDPEMSVEEDLERRDYTVNAVAVRLPDGVVVDPLGGLDDARRQLVRAVNMQVLVDDPLRVVRGVVLAAKRGLTLESETLRMLSESAESVRNLPADRIHDELDKIMGSSRPQRAIYLLHAIGVLKVVLPEVAAMWAYDQRSRYHKLDLFNHTMVVLSCASWYTDDKDVRMAALLHDVGKPSSAWTDEDGYRHYYEKRIPDPDTGEEIRLGADHEDVGAAMVRDRLSELRYATERVNKVAQLVHFHMFPYFDTSKGARRFLARVGEHADDLLVLRRADDQGEDDLRYFYMRELVERERAAESAWSVRHLAINGHDLIEMGVPNGPVRGKILRDLLDYVVDDPPLNDRETLLSLVESFRDDSWDAAPGQGAASA